MSASFKETRVTFGTQESQHLAGILTEPVDAPNSTVEEASGSNKPLYAQHCGIMCHGFASHKNGFHFPAIAAHLATQIGMSSLRFDYAGNMDSSGDFRFGGFMKEVEQMAAAKAFLEQEHHKQVVLLLGHSRGAINATLYSAKYGDIPLVMLVAGRYDLRLNMTQRYAPDVLQQLRESGPWDQTTRRDGDGVQIHWKLTAEELQERFSLDMPAACAAISQHTPQPPAVLVIHGAADAICQLSDAQKLANSISGAEFVSVQGANHWFKDRQQQLLDVIDRFVRQTQQQRVSQQQQQQQQTLISR